MKPHASLLLTAFALFAPRIARADEPVAPAAPAPAAPAPITAAAPAPSPAPAAASGVVVELSADDGRATLERRTGTTAPAFAPFDTGFLSVGQWEHACIAPCQVRLDPRYAYRVAGDGLVPTDSFALPRATDVRVDAKMGGTNGRVAGAALGMGGAGLFVLGGLALIATPILESEDVGSKGFRTGVLAGGVGAATVGLLAIGTGLALWLGNGSSARAQIARR